MITSEHIENLNIGIDAMIDAIGGLNIADLSDDKRALVDEAVEELRKAKEAVARAEAAHQAGDAAAAKEAINEAWGHIEKAAKLMKQATE